MKKYSQLLKELPSKKVVFAFGRFQPPTTGHELLVKAVQKLATAQKADHVIYASKTEDKKQNPLPVSRKVYYLQRMFPGANFVAANEQVRTFIEAAKELNKRYKNIVMVAGSDRVPEYKKLLERYNGTEFHFDTVTVVSAGERDPDSDTASGMSGTKMREAAKAGNFKEFKKGVPKTLTDLDARRLMNEIRKAYDMAPIKESLNIQVDELREKYFRGEIFNVGDIVFCEDKSYTVVKRGSNHLLLQEQGTNVKVNRWIKDVKLAEDFENPEQHNQITWQGYTTKYFDLDPAVVDAFNNTIHGGVANHVDILHAIKEVDEYLGHLKAAMATKQASPEVVANVKEHMARAREHLAKSGSVEHHGYMKNHLDTIEGFASDYQEAGKDDFRDSYENKKPLIDEALTNKTLKASSADQIKAARIIAVTLGVDNVESMSNPAQIVNLGLRKAKTKALNADSYAILQRMLKMASDIGIEYDANLLPSKLKEMYYNKLLSYDAEGRVTEIDADHDGIPDWIERNYTKIGHSLDNTQDDQLRKQKVQYHLGEANGDPKKLARQVAKAALAAKHAREKEALSKKQEQEKERISEEEQLDEISQKLAGNYYGAATKKHIEKVGVKPNMYGRIEKDMGKQRKAGIDRAMDRITGQRKTNEEYIGETALNPKDPHGDYKAKRKALDDLSKDKNVDQAHVQQRRLDLDKEYSKYHKEDYVAEGKDSFSRWAKEQAAHNRAKANQHQPKQPPQNKHVPSLDQIWKEINYVIGEIDPSSDPIDHLAPWLEKHGVKSYDVGDLLDQAAKKHGYRSIYQYMDSMREDYVQAADQKIGKDGKKHTARLIKIGSDGPGEKRTTGKDAFSEEEELKITDQEIDDMVNGITDWEHIIDAYEDDELALVDDETGEELESTIKEEVEELNEVLSRIERIKAKARFARTKTKRMVKVKLALKRSSPQSVINTRARRLAIKNLKMRIAKKPLSSLSVAEKERLEQRIHKMKPVLNRIAMKLAPKVRQIEKQRLSHSAYTK